MNRLLIGCSAVFVTMCTDCMGFFSFLGLAALFGLHG